MFRLRVHIPHLFFLLFWRKETKSEESGSWIDSLAFSFHSRGRVKTRIFSLPLLIVRRFICCLTYSGSLTGCLCVCLCVPWVISYPFFSFSELTGLASAILLALPTSTLLQHRRKEEKRGRLLTRCAINKSLFALFYKPATRSTQLVPDQCWQFGHLCLHASGSGRPPGQQHLFIIIVEHSSSLTQSSCQCALVCYGFTPSAFRMSDTLMKVWITHWPVWKRGEILYASNPYILTFLGGCAQSSTYYCKLI